MKAPCSGLACITNPLCQNAEHANDRFLPARGAGVSFGSLQDLLSVLGGLLGKPQYLLGFLGNAGTARVDRSEKRGKLLGRGRYMRTARLNPRTCNRSAMARAAPFPTALSKEAGGAS